MRYEGLLPIGSVILPKNSTKRVMITGYCQMRIDGEKKLFDYGGCLYPQGTIGPDKTILFNQDQIERVYALGYLDEEAGDFLNKAEQSLAELRKREQEGTL